jgi:hypothetical protein
VFAGYVLERSILEVALPALSLLSLELLAGDQSVPEIV